MFHDRPLIHFSSINPSPEHHKLQKELAHYAASTLRCRPIPELSDADLIVSLGGDGSLIHTLRQNHQAHAKFLALHTGHAGFFASSREPAQFLHILERAIQGELVETPLPRSHIQAHLGSRQQDIICINDFLIEKTMTWLNFQLGNWTRGQWRHIRSFRGSGIVGITPIGSTTCMAQHHLSPIIDPQLHALYLRGVNERVMPATGTLTSLSEGGIRLSLSEIETNFGIPEADRHPPRLYVDGVQYGDMECGDWLEAKPHAPAILLRPADDHWQRIYGILSSFPSFSSGDFCLHRASRILAKPGYFRYDPPVPMELPLQEIVVRLLAATVLSGLIGIEREIRQKPAGVRTNALIGLGSAVMTLAGVLIFSQFPQSSDAARIASIVVQGVGFLGAGAIIQSSGAVHGLTTAATMWVVAGIGIACGFGLYPLAGVTALIVLVLLVIFGPLDAQLMGDEAKQQARGVKNLFKK